MNNNVWADKYAKNIIANSHVIQGLIQSKLDRASVLYKIMVEIMTIPRLISFSSGRNHKRLT